METRIADLEVRLTYQESTLDELHEVMINQQSQIDVLQRKLDHLLSQIQGSDEQVASPIGERPPHY